MQYLKICQETHILSWLWRAVRSDPRCCGAHSTNKRVTAAVLVLAGSFSLGLPSILATSVRYSIGSLPTAAWASSSRRSADCSSDLLLLAAPSFLAGAAEEDGAACSAAEDDGPAALLLPGSPAEEQSILWPS